MKIKVYTTPTCIYCHALLDWFEEKRIKYTEVDASKNPEISSVPVTVFEPGAGEDAEPIEIIGFDRPALRRALKKFAA